MITVRSDLRSLEGYHSPQVDVAVRLNTNESPFAPPAGFVERLERELAAIHWNRYPDRSARELRAAIAAGEFAPYVQRFRGERATGTG